MSRTKKDSAKESEPRYAAAGKAERKQAGVAGRVPRLRFPEFTDAPEWETNQLRNSIFTISSPKKLATTYYLENGKYPIIDQSQNDIAGWTNDVSALINSDSPLVVFGDHTCNAKLVYGSFAQGADGIKILNAIKGNDIKFLYQVICSYSPQGKEYKRHFSDLCELVISKPPIIEEQQKIATCLATLDLLITAHMQKIDALVKLKRGFVLEMFPVSGENSPNMRFPEFEGDGPWVVRKNAQLLQKITNPVTVEIDKQYTQIGIRSHGKGIFHKASASGQELGSKRVFWVEENVFIVNIVFAWEQAVAVTSAVENGMIASHRFPMYKARLDKCNVNYIKHFFLTGQGKVLLGIASPGGAGRNKTLGQKEFDDISFFIPQNVKEQQRIAAFLSSLDELIAAQAAKIESIKAHKRGLMQGLFPAPDEVS